MTKKSQTVTKVRVDPKRTYRPRTLSRRPLSQLGSAASISASAFCECSLSLRAILR